MPRKRVTRTRVLTVRIPVKTLVKVTTRVILIAVLVAIVVFVAKGAKELTLAAIGTEFTKIVTDVLADRLFPHLGEDV